MLLLPGAITAVLFQASAGGQPIELESAAAIVIRNGVDTVVATSVGTPAPGRYVVSFTLPSDWAQYDKVEVRLEGSYNGLPASLTKPAGQILSEVRAAIDLLKADETIEPTRYRKYRQGTLEPLLDKAVTDDGAGSLSITEYTP